MTDRGDNFSDGYAKDVSPEPAEPYPPVGEEPGYSYEPAPPSGGSSYYSVVTADSIERLERAVDRLENIERLTRAVDRLEKAIKRIEDASQE
jgi:hypothetical protein